VRPDFKAAEKHVESAKRAVQVSQGDYYPSLGFVTQFEGNTRRFRTSGENFAVFVAAKWNIFSGFVTQERVEEVRALLERATVVPADLGQRIGLEAEEAYLGLLAAGRQITVARENVDQAAESLRIIAARYSAGLARNVDVLDAEAALKSAEQDLLRARVDTHLFRSRLNFAIGRPRLR
jgi:outer membrane protein TolC